jgi:hypothetical protein
MGLRGRSYILDLRFPQRSRVNELFSCYKKRIYTLDKNFDFALHRSNRAVFVSNPK